MPVIFVLCKHIAKNECYINFMKSLRSRLSKSSGREKDSSDQENKGKNKDEWNRSIHLAIPKPTISGLGSWVRRTERNGTGFNTQVDSYLGLESVGDDYHQHLKTEKQAARMML